MKIRNLLITTTILSTILTVNSYVNDSIDVYADIVGKADPANTDGKLLKDFSKTQSMDLSTSANMDVKYSATPNFGSDSSIELFVHDKKVNISDLPRENRSKNIILSTDQLGTDTYVYVKNALYVWDENDHKLTPRDMKVKLLGQDLTDSGVTTISVGLDKSNFLAVGGGYQVAKAGNYFHMNYQFIDPATRKPVNQKIHIGYQDVDFNEGIKIDNSAIDSIYVHNNSQLPYDLTSDNFLAVTHDYLDYSDKKDSASEPNHIVQFHLDVPKDGLNIDINTSRIKPDKYYAGSQVVPSNLKQLNYMGYQTTNFIDVDGNVIAEPTYQDGLAGKNWTTKEKSILGYRLVPDKTIGQNNGQYINGVNTEVTYVYEKETPAVKQGDLVVNYVDKDGNKVSESDTSTGDIDAAYTTKPKSIPGYKLVETPSNDQGSYVDGTTTVTYVYEKEAPNNKYTDDKMTDTKVPNKLVALPNTGVNKQIGITVLGVMMFVATIILGILFTAKNKPKK
ncbi:MucBP domain-containing protein [Weissella sp. MSCH1]|uniref:MucBP domain-containing protein n=1 Tax=Weissella sp. MSCH1 TaxID=3383343 RepID=UPI003896E681